MSTQPRRWNIDGDALQVDDEESLGIAISESVTILSRIGGAIIIVAQREQVAEDIWQTVGYAFKWASYAPAKRLEPEPTQPEPEPVGTHAAD